MHRYGRRGTERGLKQLDKRQGWRGAIDNLTGEDAQNLVADLQEEYGTEPLTIGNTYKGLVTGVDDSKNLVTVNLGNAEGRFPFGYELGEGI